MELGKCKPEGKLLIPNMDYTFNKHTEDVTLYDLRITKKGMYIISITINTNNSKFQTIDCSSKTILVKEKSTSAIRTQNNDSNIILTFGGNSTLSHKILNEYKTILYNCFILQNGLNLKNEIIFQENKIQFFLTVNDPEESVLKLIPSFENFSISSDFLLRSASINLKYFTFYNLQQVPYTIKEKDSQNYDMVL